MTVGELKELLSKYNDGDQVILSTGFHTVSGREAWVETENFTLTPLLFFPFNLGTLPLFPKRESATPKFTSYILFLFCNLL